MNVPYARYGSYGLPPDIHGMKLHPWVVRLKAASGYLVSALSRSDYPGMIRGMEDTSFWVGRVICDAIGSANEKSDPDDFRAAAKAVMDAQAAILRAKMVLVKRLR
jgi:hypothetical protein